MRKQPFASPGEALEHYGVKGMKWGVRKEYTPVAKSAAGKLTPGTPEFQEVMGRLTRTDRPQALGLPTSAPKTKSKSNSGVKTNQTGKIESAPPPQQKEGLTRNQKIALTFGAATAVAAGYVAYRHFTGDKLTGLDLAKMQMDEKDLAGMVLPKSWDVSGLKNGPLSTQRLGDLAGGEFNMKLIGEDSLVINTARGYADILPKGGLSNPFAIEQHASVTRVLEEMRDKYPSIRNMNIEVVPMSRIKGMDNTSAFMSVMSMRAGEARVMYNDTMDAPTAATILQNKKFLPGLGIKDYVARHEMGHLLAVANGDLPPAFEVASGKAGPDLMNKWQKAEPLLHKQTFAKYGFSFKELSKISGYAATEPAEAMAELVGHVMTPELRGRLTPDQLTRAEAMINEMGGRS